MLTPLRWVFTLESSDSKTQRAFIQPITAAPIVAHMMWARSSTRRAALMVSIQPIPNVSAAGWMDKV